MKSPIRLFGLSSCPHCNSLRQFLVQRGVPFDHTILDLLIGEERNQAMRRLREINPSVSFPTLVVGDRVIVGFKRELISKAVDEAMGESTDEVSIRTTVKNGEHAP